MDDLTGQVTPVPQNPVPPSQPVPAKKPFPKWPFLALFAFFLGIGSVFAYQRFQPARTVPVTPSPSSTPVLPSPSPDPTAGWKTYFNATHQLGFKYPADWQLDNSQDSDPINADLNLIKGSAKIQMYFNMDGIGGQGQNYEGEPVIISGINLYRYHKFNSYNQTQSIGISNSLTNTLGVFRVNGLTYSIVLNYPHASVQANELEKDYDLILSTFKFTGQSQPGGSAASYQDCVNTPGSVLQTTYPATCITPDGQSFTEPVNE